ncbi:1-phosphofructokinase family hexose kinase [Mycolicibacterium goodii]|uniref:1-phosphofructokinase family hexose kinase n=1 Tax=Mycolicibacterium goodii TaxID=134601 RepID=A0ABS6HS15_MYCGD|nr:1-phosphofructokinase family hexose kinase [Mycolicibacterium goodii]MBU8825482.1 1-phosphofructokinase family hexose kinase [Mycolicibacterium goodii]MBU8838628.1 1-phosphofructokinase family hexose kinase [Mycolicibacterium goodii]
MIVTVTPNPSLDRTLHLPMLRPGEVNRATSTMTEPSGKGVNVALALHGAGHATRAVLPVGGSVGAEIVSALQVFGLDMIGVPVYGAVRSNVTLVEADGRSTKVNEPGPHLSADEVDALCAAAVAQGGDWVVWAGSLPAGFAPQRLAAAVGEARAAGRRVAVDASGPALAAVLAADRAGLPHLIKPNVDELADVVDRPMTTLADVVTAARALTERGVDTVLVSLGGDGAVLVTATLALHGAAPVERVVNTVGAGDALLAGYLAAWQEKPTDALASALRFGATAVEHQGTLIGLPDPQRPVSIGPVRGDLRLG